MTLLHPSRTGSPVAVWFLDGAPVRLLSGDARFRVTEEPRCADINGVRYWRVRARAEDGQVGTFDIREAVDGEDADAVRAGEATGWILIGVDEDPTRVGRR